MSRYKDLIVGVFFAALAIAYYLLSFQIEEAGASAVGPGFMPQIFAAITLVLAVILIGLSMGKLRKEKALSGAKEEAAPEQINYIPLVLSVVLLLAYIYALEPVGFIIATAVYLFAQFNVSAPRDKRGLKYQTYFLVGAVVAGFAVNYIFVNGFNVMLPQGLLD